MNNTFWQVVYCLRMGEFTDNIQMKILGFCATTVYEFELYCPFKMSKLGPAFAYVKCSEKNGYSRCSNFWEN